jgi:hypothetical protein
MLLINNMIIICVCVNIYYMCVCCIYQESREYWDEVHNGEYLFNRTTLMAQYLSTVTLEDVKSFFQKYIVSDAPLRKKFSSQFFGSKTKYPRATPHNTDNTCYVTIDNPMLFKRNMPLLSSRYSIDAVEIVDVE